jgi:hypothetical protein
MNHKHYPIICTDAGSVKIHVDEEINLSASILRKQIDGEY